MSRGRRDGPVGQDGGTDRRDKGEDGGQRGDEGGVAEDRGGHSGDVAYDRRPVGGRRSLSRPREE